MPTHYPRFAAIDLGTNTLLLCIVERRGAELRTLVERASITRLGAGVDQTRRLASDSVTRTLACLLEYAEAVRDAQVTSLDVVGTSALRDAAGAESFLDEAERILGARPRVIAGAEEAELTFAGATSGLALSGRVLVFDVGGGSTEIVEGEIEAAAKRITRARSIDIGSVRLFERHVHIDPPSLDEQSAVIADVVRALGPAPELASPFSLVGVAGTVTTLAAIERGESLATPGLVHGARLSRERVDAVGQRLWRTPLDERLALPGLEPGRADVIPIGAAIVSAILAWSGATELTVSDRGVRWGLIESRLAG